MAETDTQTAPATTPATTTTLTPAERAARLARAETLVKDHMLMSAAAGLIPLPIFDIVAGMGIQIALVKRLADLYHVPFSAHAARGIITSLVGAVGTSGLSTGIISSAMKIVPGAGSLVGVVTMPIALSAVTYAVGKLFVAHFEVGGTLADLNALAQRPYFKQLLERGREVASSLTPSSAAKDPARP